MKILKCECGYEEAIPNEDEELRLETMRCPNCGKVGTLKEQYR
ncbi:MAG: hypothetical protein ACTSQ8_24220 [Candidatus Helarchaeota archaeon]